MKKAVIAAGGHQYIVKEGETLEVELLGGDKNLSFVPLIVFDGEKITVGTPNVAETKVTAEFLGEVRGEKVTAIRYEAKKRVKKIHGHRQHLAQIRIIKIA